MRISTQAASQAALMDLMRAQREAYDARDQLASGKKAPDRKGYANTAETIISARAAQERSESFASANSRIMNRLEIQDLAYQELSEAATDLRTALTTNDGSFMMDKVQEVFDQASAALNMRFNGSYVFGGVRTDALPFTADTIADLQRELKVPLGRLVAVDEQAALEQRLAGRTARRQPTITSLLILRGAIDSAGHKLEQREQVRTASGPSKHLRELAAKFTVERFTHQRVQRLNRVAAGLTAAARRQFDCDYRLRRNEGLYNQALGLYQEVDGHMMNDARGLQVAVQRREAGLAQVYDVAPR